jgi:hypothetical protein
MRESKLPLQLKCPNCGNKMEKGYVALITDRASVLYFSREIISAWTGSPGKEKDKIIGSNLVSALRNDYIREGFRCEDCDLVIIDRKKYDYKGFSALKGENEFNF